MVALELRLGAQASGTLHTNTHTQKKHDRGEREREETTDTKKESEKATQIIRPLAAERRRGIYVYIAGGHSDLPLLHALATL